MVRKVTKKGHKIKKIIEKGQINALQRQNGQIADNDVLIGTIYVVLSAAGFATLAIFGKWTLAAGFSLSASLAWRFIAATVLLVPMVVGIAISARWTRWRRFCGEAIAMPSWRQGAWAFALGAVGYTVQACLFFAALARTSAAVTSLLLYTYPGFVVLLHWWIWKESLPRRRVFALVCALSGVLLTLPMAALSDQEFVGAGIALTSGLWYSCYLTFGLRKVSAMNPFLSTTILAAGAALSFTTMAWARGEWRIPQGSHEWAMIAGLGALGTVLPVVALFAGISRLGISRAAIVATAEPVMTVLFGWWLLGEKLELVQCVGGCLVVLAAIILQKESSQPAKVRHS